MLTKLLWPRSLITCRPTIKNYSLSKRILPCIFGINTNPKLREQKLRHLHRVLGPGTVQTTMALSEPSSQSNPDDMRIVHSDIKMTVAFDRRVIVGIVTHHTRVVKETATQLILDTRGLQIASVSVNGRDAPFGMSQTHPVLGSQLVIEIPPQKEDEEQEREVRVAIHYETAPESTALQWLSPTQTTGKKMPFLFSQCQAIHARSLIPCQDTPGVKFTYTLELVVPEGMVALASALLEGQTGCTYNFKQPQPIPSYLLGIAVGDLRSIDLSPVTRVWAEPLVVDSAAFEFADTPKFLEAAESIAGDYVWQRYDLLILPSSYPYGGMENPCVSFLTPTLLAGDRSLANVVVHELSHSWTGNLVTNKEWRSFWLNEGFTVFLERKILGLLYGDSMYNFHATQGLIKLQKTVRDLGADNPFTRLVPDLSGGVDPDDAFSAIPYEKGFYFLHYLQSIAGGAKVFEPFLKAYLRHFQDTPVGTEDFKAYYLNTFTNTEAVHDIDWETWLYGLGMPPSVNSYDGMLVEASNALAVKWHTVDVLGVGLSTIEVEGVGPHDLDGWSSPQIAAFLDKLGELRSMRPLHTSVTRKMNGYYSLDASTNSEILCSWLLLCIKARDRAIYGTLKDFLLRQGRMKYIRPLYKNLMKSGDSEAVGLAKEVFELGRQGYHPIAAKMVAADLGLRN